MKGTLEWSECLAFFAISSLDVLLIFILYTFFQKHICYAIRVEDEEDPFLVVYPSQKSRRSIEGYFSLNGFIAKYYIEFSLLSLQIGKDMHKIWAYMKR